MADGEQDMRRQIPKANAQSAVNMLVAVHRAHVTLSQMADQKASILMGATFVIFTITIGQAKTAGGPPLPLLILGAFAFFSAVLAVFSILPHIHTIRAERPNLLFFGQFSQLAEEEYLDRLYEGAQDDSRVFGLMARDIYQNGVILEFKKYRTLGYAYRVFLTGLTLSFAAFLFQFATHEMAAKTVTTTTVVREAK